MAVRGSHDQRVQRHGLEPVGHASARHASARRANVRCGYHRCVNGCDRILPNRSPVGTRPSIGPAMFGHAEVGNQSARNKPHRFRTGSLARRRPVLNDSDSGLSSDTQPDHILGSRRDRDDSGGVNRDGIHIRNHGGCRTGREQNPRGGFRKGIVRIRELRCSRKVPTRIVLPMWWCETWFDPVGLS